MTEVICKGKFHIEHSEGCSVIDVADIAHISAETIQTDRVVDGFKVYSLTGRSCMTLKDGRTLIIETK